MGKKKTRNYSRQTELGYLNKTCVRCKQSFPLAAFYSSGDYLSSFCRNCSCNQTKKFYRENRKTILSGIKERRMKYPDRRWAEYRSDARADGREFTLPRALFDDLISDYCFYCGSAPSPWNGIDRVDSAKGYFDGNVVTACRHCNRAKLARSRQEFEAWIHQASRHLKSFEAL